MWIIGSEGLFRDHQRTLVERLGFGVRALGFVEQRPVVEGLTHVGVVRSRVLALGTLGFAFWSTSSRSENINFPAGYTDFPVCQYLCWLRLRVELAAALSIDCKIRAGLNSPKLR